MNTESMRTQTEADSPDEPIVELVDEYLRRLRAGERLDPEVFANEHPEHAGELRELLPMMVALAGSTTNGASGPSGEPGDADERCGRPFGDYRLERTIGRGGMGVVYEAWQHSMDRRVALKILPAGLEADPRAFVRFMREAQTAGQLSHPNIVAVHSTGVEQGTPWYSMEYVEGETLAEVLSDIGDAEDDAETRFGRRGARSYYEALAEHFADVADGLWHAHSKGVVHRDIKPSNLILDGEGRLRILDFGLARLEGQESLTLSGDVVGTPLYMSPEQARRRKVPIDHRTDVYSLGATMYQAVAGRAPFGSKSHAETLSQIIEKDPVEPRRLDARVPRDLETIVLHCLRKDPDDRYGTAEALGQDLRRFVRGDPIEAARPSRIERASRRLWRHRWLLGATTAVLALIIAGLVVALVVVGEKERETQAALADAREDFARARGVVDRFLTLLAKEELAVQPGMEATRREFLESALDFYASVYRDRGELPGVREQIGRIQRRLGRLYDRLGEPELAEAAHREAIATFLDLSTQSPENVEYREELAESWTLLAVFLETGRRVDESRELFAAALDVRKELVDERPHDARTRLSYAMALGNAARRHFTQVGSQWGRPEDLEKALDYLDRSGAEYRVVLEANPEYADARLSFASTAGPVSVAF